MNQYGNKDYWNKRYEKDAENFEWYQQYGNLKAFLLPILQKYKNPKILNIGCGNSKISEELYKEGFKNITNIDYSSVVINQMQIQYSSDFESMKFIEMDACDMDFENGSFDVVIDKGTLDSILCGEGSS